MPLRRFLPLMLLAACATAWAEQDVQHWLDRDALDALPEDVRPDIKPWCEGVWFNPLFATVPESQDTVITAAESSLTPNGLVSLQGEVEIRQPDRLLTAERAELDQSSGDFVMNGGIEVQTPQFTLQADSFTGNTRNREASLTGTRYALFGLPARGEAGSLEQAGEKVFIHEGSYTSCPPNNDAWILSADEIELNQDSGWGEAWDVVLRVKGVPVAYIPWITFPIDDRRKTGLLFPNFSSSSDNGLDISTPVYLNIHPQFDATVAPRHVEKRGSGAELETRYLTHWGEGSISYGGIANDRLFDDQDREVARWQHQANLRDWLLDADVNYASDDFFFKDLGTGLAISSQTHLVRQGSAQWFGQNWLFSGRVQSFQTIDPNIADEDLPYRRLPQLQLQGRQTIAGPLAFTLDTELTRFDRNVDAIGEDITGDRGYAAPGLEVDWRTSWGYLTPAARVYRTQYRLAGDDAPSEVKPDLTVAGASLHGGLFLERPLTFSDHTLIQTLEPELRVNYIEHEQQDDLPVFDTNVRSLSWQALFAANRFSGHDRIGDDYSTTLGLTSRFVDARSGQEWLRLRTAQRRFWRDRRVQLDGAAADERELTPLLSDLRLSLNESVSLFLENQWDSDNNRRVANRARLSANDGRRYLHAGMIQQVATGDILIEDDLMQGELAALVPVHTHWSLLGRWLYDVDNSRTLESVAGVEYQNCCWRASLVGQRQLEDKDGDGDLEADRTILFQIQLTGLGGFGDKLDSLLERSIPDYRRDND